MEPCEKKWIVYLLGCRDRTFYCGITNDLPKRLEAHRAGTGAKYTKSRRPFTLLGEITVPDKSTAAKVEYLIKQQPKFVKLRIFRECRNYDEFLKLAI
ncbi:MAG: GIY-YIG nuclease family protein [Candidatus Aenigmatarchaeota archaeon]